MVHLKEYTKAYYPLQYRLAARVYYFPQLPPHLCKYIHNHHVDIDILEISDEDILEIAGFGKSRQKDILLRSIYFDGWSDIEFIRPTDDRFYGPRQIEDRRFMEIFLRKWGMVLWKCPDTIANDFDLCLIAIYSNYKAYPYVGSRLKGDDDFNREVSKLNAQRLLKYRRLMCYV